MKVGSVKIKIMLEFLAIITPLALVLIYQTIADVSRSAEMERAFRMNVLSNDANAQYKVFVNGVTDAVDTGQVSSKAIQALDKAKSDVQGLQVDAPAVKSVLQELDKIISTVQGGAAIARLLPLKDTIHQVGQALEEHDARYQKINREVIEHAISSSSRQQMIVIISTIFTLLLAVFFIRGLVKGLTEPLDRAVGVANRIANGEISGVKQIDTKHDIGQLLHSLGRMNDSLRTIISSVQDASNSLGRSADTLSDDVVRLKESAQIESERVSETNASIQAMNDAMHAVVVDAGKAVEAAAQAQQVAQNGNSNMEKSLQATERVVQTMESSSLAISQLSESVLSVSDVTKMIKDIADQTNLLALNAAIEAARAGEQGRGFAVVADEVRKLAERTTSSTTEISRMLESINAQTANVVQAIDKAKVEVQDGANFSRITSGLLHEIVEAAQQVSGMSQSIASAAHQQSISGEAAMQNMGQIADITEENATHIRQIREASDQLAATASELKRGIGHFKLA